MVRKKPVPLQARSATRPQGQQQGQPVQRQEEEFYCPYYDRMQTRRGCPTENLHACLRVDVRLHECLRPTWPGPMDCTVKPDRIVSAASKLAGEVSGLSNIPLNGEDKNAL